MQLEENVTLQKRYVSGLADLLFLLGGSGEVNSTYSFGCEIQEDVLEYAMTSS